jgi:hypothetical protein
MQFDERASTNEKLSRANIVVGEAGTVSFNGGGETATFDKVAAL